VNWYKRANKLTEILRKHPADTSLIHLLKSLGFDGNGDILKDEQPAKTKEERKKAAERWHDEEYEHGPA
jgi:hypothetical protein